MAANKMNIILLIHIKIFAKNALNPNNKFHKNKIYKDIIRIIKSIELAKKYLY